MKKIIKGLITIFIVISFMHFNNVKADEIINVNSSQDIIDVINSEFLETSMSLNNDIVLTETLVIPQNKNITLFLNNHILTTVSNETGIDGIVIKGQLNLYDKIDGTRGNGKILSSTEIVGASIVSMGRVIHVNPNGIFNFYNGILSNGYDELKSGGVYNEGTFNMFGSKFLSIHDYYDGAIIQSCNSSFAGGGIHNSGLFNMYGGLIQSCYSHVGGGIYCFRNSKTNIETGTIIFNSAGETGGGIYCDYESELNIVNDGTDNKHVLIDSNNAGYIGGGIALSPDDKVKLIGNVRITLNTAPSSGGIANGSGVDNLEVGGNLICRGNHFDNESPLQNNIGIFSDSTIKIVEPLGNDSDLGFHMDDLSLGSKIISSGVLEEYIDSKIYSDFEDDYLLFNNGSASLDLKEFLVSFDTRGGSEVSSQTIERGKYIVNLLEPTKEGYDFGSWQLKDADGFYIDVEPRFLRIFESTTYYARWNYQILRGANSIWHKNDTNDIVIISKGHYDDCLKINFDYIIYTKEDIDGLPEMFELKKTSEGYTCLTIKKYLLDLLEIDDHYIDLIFVDNVHSETTLSIKKALPPVTPPSYIVPNTGIVNR